MAINFNQLRLLTSHFQESAATPGQIEFNPALAGFGMSMAAGGTLGMDTSATRPAVDFSAAAGSAWTFAADDLVVTGSPTIAGAVPTKQYVDNLVSGLSWKNPVLSGSLFGSGEIAGVQIVVCPGTALTNADTINLGGFVITGGLNFTDEASLASFINSGSLLPLWTATVVTSVSSIAPTFVMIKDIGTNGAANRGNGIISNPSGVFKFLDFSTSQNQAQTSADLVPITVHPATRNFSDIVTPVTGESRLTMDTDKQYVYDIDTTSWVQFSTGSLTAGAGLQIASNVVSVATDGIVTSMILNANVTPAKLSFAPKNQSILASAGAIVAGNTDLALTVAPSADALLIPGYVLLRNGIDDMTYVAGAPAGAGQWTFSGSTISIFGDVTASGDVYTMRYMA